MRLGLIGLGRIGAFHAETLTGLGVDLVVYDPAPGVTERVATKYAAKPGMSVPGVLEAGIDGLVIAAATDAHPQLIIAGTERGLPVFCEKPVARGATEAADIQRRTPDARVQIGYNRRFDEAIQRAKHAVESGELGRLHTIRSTTMDPAPPPAAYLEGSGGIFRDCSVHDFDTIRYVTGREVIEVYATGSDRGDEVFARIGDASTTAAVLTLDDGTIAVVSNTRYNGRGYDVRLELHGSADSIATGLDDRWPMRSAEPGVTFPAGPPHDFFMDRFLDAYRRELAAFTELVAGERESPCTVADAVEAGWIAEACTTSLREHRPVRIDEVKS